MEELVIVALSKYVLLQNLLLIQSVVKIIACGIGYFLFILCLYDVINRSNDLGVGLPCRKPQVREQSYPVRIFPHSFHFLLP
jgi:hypothetical protein